MKNEGIVTILKVLWALRSYSDDIKLYTDTGCPRRNVPNFGRVFFMLKYTDITQNTYIQSWWLWR
jgi:hypothetical protein